MASAIKPSAAGLTPLEKKHMFKITELEMESRVELFNKYKEAELNLGETSCIDRCASKNWHVTNLIGQLLGAKPPLNQ